ncbi:aldo/keto reductase [Aliishimia ponticola]|uniref:Aldo/keto reductase n=1 Tax=Aliishimia ponticola TaxID=2499833 RepID=A0A4S4N9Z3_9RHOB|nr:aldo/keto reductase [Aliishimia ponticola]THH36086.1 aldo/keto reductase [Aliishimia ponticola]
MTQLTTLSGDALAPIAFGAMQFGGKADETAARAMFDACRAAGIRHFDTAWGYTEGRSEEMLGRLIDDRDSLFIASKVAYTGGADRANITAQLDTSRRRLGLDCIDLLYLHRFDADTPLEETIETMAGFQSAGLIRLIGLSNYAAWQVMKAQGIAQQLGTRIDVIQPMYNLVKRQAEVELLPMCADQGIVACTYSPLGGGLLSGKYQWGGTGRLTEDARYNARYAVPQMHDASEGLTQIAVREGVHPATLAVAWVMGSGFGAQPILSASHPEQLKPSLEALTFNLRPDLHAELTALMPAPPPATDRIEEA